ncbi:xanthine dehydrogenase family Fe-S subunit [Serratia fonticola]|uniref:xanthine dehydrogenase family Fe-S subunit n=1 Tax=Serratia fonticola TaxID=47917 RepID=UPI000E2D66C4|nr:2Fe-2S iron-sulfur cluster-binding protein [Serratia fonticola]RDL15143.1 carbon-monoxide dehydrogenase small subunit [Serratia fonticola]
MQTNKLNQVSLEVNGKLLSVFVEDRTSLADLLRDELDLTGTHLGCEHGVCGACTLEINGHPSRSCITLAKNCNKASIRTIEDFNDDPVMSALREAFSENHALQCGFCTSGMLSSARDIVLRGVENEEETIRTAMSGNLCRCTGYMGIIKSVRSVLAIRESLIDITSIGSQKIAPARNYTGDLPAFERKIGKIDQLQPSIPDGDEGNQITESINLNQSIEDVWHLMRNVEQVVNCVPGARLLEQTGDDLKIMMEASFGAISASFKGDGRFTFNDNDHTGRFEGQGKDARSGSGASGALSFRLEPKGSGCNLNLVASYEVTGALAQFSRGGLVKSFAKAITSIFGENLAKSLKGETVDSSSGAKLNVFKLILMVIKGFFKR